MMLFWRCMMLFYKVALLMGPEGQSPLVVELLSSMIRPSTPTPLVIRGTVELFILTLPIWRSMTAHSRATLPPMAELFMSRVEEAAVEEVAALPLWRSTTAYSRATLPTKAALFMFIGVPWRSTTVPSRAMLLATAALLMLGHFPL
jgi:hypothetical protein